MLTEADMAAAREMQALVWTETIDAATVGEPVFDPGTGQTTPAVTVLYNGPGRAAQVTAGGPTVTAAGVVVTPTTVAVTVPWDVHLPTGTRVKVTRSTVGSPLLGSTVWVDADVTQHGVTARRYMCRDTQ